jgi:hypothetical protein
MEDKPGIDERYSSATHASSLVVQERTSGPGDVLMAAAWSKSRTGAALMRLHSEWDGVEKPRAVLPQAIERMAETLAKESGQWKGAVTKEFRSEARYVAAKWLEHEHKILLGKLKTLPEVRGALTDWCERQGYKNPVEKAMIALIWWLDPICPTCHGRKFETIKDTPVLSGRLCPECKGSGLRSSGAGIELPVLVGYIGDCVNAARAQMRGKLRHFAPSKETT